MKILINGVSAVAGGGITYLNNLLTYLPDLMPNDEFLVVIQGIDLPKEVYQKKNLIIKKISDKVGSENIIKRYWWENTSLIKLCKLWKADILYCIANITPILPSNTNTVVMIQNVAPLTDKVLFKVLKSEGIKSFLKMFINCLLTLYAGIISKRIIVLSESSNKLIKEWLPNCNTEIVHHGITSIFKTGLPKPHEAGKEPYFIFVSNIYAYKGIEYIIDAYKTKPNLPHIFLIGQPYDFKYMKRIKEQISLNKLNNKIIFLNSLPFHQLPSWYANAIANIFPSWCESFGCGIIESQACGCPVVGMKTVTLPEFSAIPELLVEPFNGKALAEAMEKAIELRKDKNLSQNLSKYAQQFTWEKAMEKHRDIFRNEK